MQKILINLLGVILVLAVAIAAISRAEAAPAEVPPAEVTAQTGPFNGIFYGWINGDEDSRAPMILDLNTGPTPLIACPAKSKYPRHRY